MKALLREPAQRPGWVKERLKALRDRQTSRTLNINAATLIARELKDFEPKKQMIVACFLLDKSNEDAKKLIEKLKNHQNSINSMEELYELYDEIMSGTSKISRTVRLDRETANALDEACLDRQTYYRDLMSRIIREWLRKKGYLE